MVRPAVAAENADLSAVVPRLRDEGGTPNAEWQTGKSLTEDHEAHEVFRCRNPFVFFASFCLVFSAVTPEGREEITMHNA